MHRAVFYALIGLLTSLSLFGGQIMAYPSYAPKWTKVEQKFLSNSGRQATYPHEFIPVIETRNDYELGKLAALRFIEWAIANPNGVISLTSGRTPEYFIKFLGYYKRNWNKPVVQAELQSLGIKQKNFPVTSNMKFVQIEEFYPISPNHYKNVTNFVKRHYIKLLGIKKENMLIMDLANRGILAEKGLNLVFMNGKVDMTLLQRKPSSQLEGWQEQAIREARAFCTEYEKKIRAWGGIDFFLGSLSYHGDLGLNIPGTAFNTQTHIVKLDYGSEAHGAKDLGGIEHARGKVAVSIGLGTIAFKPNAVMIVIVAGEGKAPVVRDSIQNKPDTKYPSTVLQKYPNTRFYLNSGAAKLLTDRRTEDVKIGSRYGWNQKLIESVIIEIALAENKPIFQLTNADLAKHERGKLLLQAPPKPLQAMLTDVHNSIIKSIESGLTIGLSKAQKVLHTGPHPDDIMLAYYPLMDNFMHKYKNHFAYITSGFNSVTDSYILTTLNRASDWWLNQEADTIFRKPYNKTLAKFRNYFVKQDIKQMEMLDTVLVLKHLVKIYNLQNMDQLKQTIRWLKDDYFPHKQPGESDVASIKSLKGMIRESEVDRMWSLKNVPLQNITHLRSKFYTSKEFSKTPRIDADVMPFLSLYNSYRPDVITVADDPQSTPPITHYKAMQVVAQALRSKDAVQKADLQIWGYRNVWFRYRPQDANIYVPVSEKMLDAQKKVFMSCFTTQKSASYPSPFFAGDFATLTAKIQREHLAELKVLLGSEYFSRHSIAELKNASGFIFLRQMNVDEFFQRVEDLDQAMTLEKEFEAARA